MEKEQNSDDCMKFVALKCLTFLNNISVNSYWMDCDAISFELESIIK